MNTEEAKLVQLQTTIDRTTEELGNFLNEIKSTCTPTDFHKITQLLLNTLQVERRWALSALYLEEALYNYAQRISDNSDDITAVAELSTLLRLM